MAQTTATERDAQHIWRAIELASLGRGHTSPNPLVGAVIVRDGRTLGEGFHAAAGDAHAERAALAACSADPAGSTMYVSLEPCCHEGRTPPCTDAIVEAGIGRVVVASDDPSQVAAGRGLGILRDEGVQVDVLDGDVARAARLLNQPFRKHARTARPLVILKSAMTLDGKVATRTGDSQWISGEASRARANHWRSECDAVAVGIGTAIADDPQLTARTAAMASQPLRVVFDSELSLPLGSRLVSSAAEVPVAVVCSRAAKRTAIETLEAAGVEVIVTSGQNEAARVGSALGQLGARGVQSLLLEGGPHMAGVFLEADEVDEARMFVAPMLAGGREGKSAIGGQGIERIDDALVALHTAVERIEDDVLISARFKEW